jgi:hypothetical protein
MTPTDQSRWFCADEEPNEIRKTAEGLATHPPFAAILDRGVDVPGGNPDLCMVRRSGVALRRSGPGS